MSTFPRRVKQLGSGTLAQPLLTRPTSDSNFDAGLNSSAAWTEHLDLAREHESDRLSLSDVDSASEKNDYIEANQDYDDWEERVELARGRPARVLYDFNGESTAQELSVRAGDELEILHETIERAEGWSFARIPLRVDIDEDQEQDEDDADSERGGAVGLVPREYYAFTTDFVSSPASDSSHTRDASTPRASANPPLVPQNTGEWFRHQVRRSLLGGRSLNRFSRFVTSGVETFILRGAPRSSVDPTSTAPAPQPTSENSKSELRSETDGLPPALDFRLSTYIGHGHAREASAVAPEADHDTHFIDVDDTGPVWRAKVPPFNVRVHSPEKRYPTGGASSDVGAYIVYSITSSFPSSSLPTSSSSDEGGHEDSDESELEHVHAAPQILTVQRRFSHFVLLHNALSARLPGLALPPLPEKQYAGRLSTAFVEARRGALQRYLRALVRHPVVRYAEALTFFLACEDEVEWRRQLPHHLHGQPAGASFFANVFHLPFQVDSDDVADEGERFENHTRAVSRGVQQLRGTMNKVRGARLEMSNAERLLSYAILSLITSTPLGSGSMLDDESNEDEEEIENGAQSPVGSNGRSRSCKRKKGLRDSAGAWCWREDCPDCLRLTKGMQKTAETLQGVADLYDGHARRTMLETEDTLKDVAHPDTIYAPVLDIHNETLERYKEASDSAHSSPSSDKVASDTQKAGDDDNVAMRCETVLNTTMAEFDVYHSQKRDDFERITKAHLDGEIAFYEKVLARLRTTRALFETGPEELALTMPGVRVPSIYERELGAPRVAEPLPQPAPHVLDTSGPSMRPVSAAIQGLLGIGGTGLNGKDEERYANGDGDGRGSMFGRFW